MSVMPYKSELQQSRQLDARAIASNFERNGEYATDPAYGYECIVGALLAHRQCRVTKGWEVVFHVITTMREGMWLQND